MDKLIITAAITGNITLPVQTPHLPLTPQQIIDDAVRAANAGAASVHIHGRDPKLPDLPRSRQCTGKSLQALRPGAV